MDGSSAHVLGPVVVGVDGGEEARHAVRLARRMAEAAGAELVLVHAYPYDLLPLEGTVAEVGVSEELHRDAARFVAALRDAIAPGARTRVTPDTSPARALHEVCEQEGARLLVVGSTARGVRGRCAAGETARAALHDAPCPVLVAARGGTELRTVGVGYDGSDEARHALATATAVASAAGARLVLLTAVDRPDEADAARARADAAAPDGAAVEVLQGGAADALAPRSAELDLLVLGSRGLGPVRRLLLGSTSERAVREAGCAVLVVPRGAG